MLINKFPYVKISRVNVNNKRHYAVLGSIPLPSVTTILSETKPSEAKESLWEWKRRVGLENAQAITTEAANRGTRMHSYLEKYIKNGELPECGSNPYSSESYNMAQIIINKGLNKVSDFYGSEVCLYMPKMYAGTTDCIALHENKLAILDFKQTNTPKKDEWVIDYKLQIASYILAHDEVYNTHMERGVILMCSKNLEYQEWIIEGLELQKYKDAWWKRLDEYYTRKMVRESRGEDFEYSCVS